MNRTALKVAAALLSVALLVGCTQTKPSKYESGAGNNEKLAGSLTELFQQELSDEESAKNPFVADVLKRAINTGRITQVDYEEAYRLFRVCLKDAGYVESYEKLPNGLYKATPPNLKADDSEKYMEASKNCSDELAPIESLYTVQQGNPNLLTNQDQAVVQCLNKAGLVDASYTVAHFKSDFKAGFTKAPYDATSPGAQACFAGGGYSITLKNP
ncbi:MAG: hypothetical protein B5766_12460 [Candidatus Lumbricidophila eiseniae]|uniref:Lipoprotein n=1 Tax=Candidatus Lumbricidiphila eiseniae TaxID=1969409 RepID=A0A2A6FNH9_9MICO|nr:MAG: hypothetical protein B5766_12460 [Candidatus Lumbricidophila eiseniae]